MSTQKQNAEMVELLRPSFVGRSEPNYSIGQAASTYLMLPELRMFVPFSSINNSGTAQDLSGQARHLTNNGAIPRIVTGIVPFAQLDGAAMYWSRADEAGLDITGAVTIGGWFVLNAVPAALGGIAGKGATAGNQRAYEILCSAVGNGFFRISTDGTATVDSPPVLLPLATPVFLAGRFTPNTEVAYFQNKTKYATVAGVPATLFNSTANLEIGRRNAAATFVQIDCSMFFLCAAALSDAIIINLYESGKALFGL